MGSSDGSSSPSTVTMLVSRLLSDEKEDVRRWLRTDIQSLLDPLVDCLFDKLNAKLTTALGFTDGDDRTTQANDIFHQPHHRQHYEHYTSNEYLHNSEFSAAAGSDTFDAMHENPTIEVVHPPKTQMKRAFDNSSQNDTLEPEVNLNVKEEFDETTTNKRMTTNQASPSMFASTSNEQTNSNDFLTCQKYDHDYWEDDYCECDDCVNGGNHIKEEDDQDNDNAYNGRLVEGNNADTALQTSRPAKKARIDSNSAHRGQSRTNKKSLKKNADQVVTLQLKCLSNCELLFATRGELNCHMLNVHSIRLFRCLLKNCGMSFNNNRILREHIEEVHQQTTTTEWHCDKCPKYFTSYSLLSFHNIKQHHLGQFQCSFAGCGFVGDYRGKVYDHFKLQHKPKPELACCQSACTFRTKHSAQLKAHERAHFGIRPFRCRWPDCGYAATQRAQAMSHIRRMHFGRNSQTNETLRIQVKEYLEVVEELL